MTRAASTHGCVVQNLTKEEHTLPQLYVLLAKGGSCKPFSQECSDSFQE